MKRPIAMCALVIVSTNCICSLAISQSNNQSNTGPSSGTTQQPPAQQAAPLPAQLSPSSIVPDNPVLPPGASGSATHKTGPIKTVPHGPGQFPMTIPYRPWRGLIALDGFANGNNPARFIISSALNMSTVSPEDAIRLQLTTSSTKAHVALLDTSTDVPTASILNLKLGSNVIHDINVAQVNLIKLLSRDPVVDAPTCWLGTSWLSGYLVTLNFDRHTVVLDQKTAPFEKPAGYIVPFKLKDGKPIIKVNIAGGGSYEAMVDTGSMGTLIPSAIALKLKAKKLDKNTPKTGVDIGAGMMGRMVVPKISVGKAELKNLMVAYFGPAAPEAADKTMGVIGMDFLRRFRVTFSYAKSQLALYAPEIEASHKDDSPAPPIRKPGSGTTSGPFGNSPFGTNPGSTIPGSTYPTGTIPH